MGVAPDAGAVLGDREVEARGGKRNVLGARLDEWKLEPELLLAPPGRGELGRSDVDADRARAPPGEPRRDVGRAAAELDDVEPFDLTERPERRLRVAEDAPGDLGLGPVVAARASVYSAFACVQSSRLRFASSEMPISEMVGSPGCAPGTVRANRRGRTAQLALRARLRVRAVDDVLGEQRREVAADRARRRVGRVAWRPSSRARRGSRSRRGRPGRARGPR